MKDSLENSWIIKSQEEFEKRLFEQDNSIWGDLWGRYFKHLNKIFGIMNGDKLEQTKEEQIISVFKESGLSVTNKTLMEKFGCNELYLTTLRNRIKNGNIKIEKDETK